MHIMLVFGEARVRRTHKVPPAACQQRKLQCLGYCTVSNVMTSAANLRLPLVTATPWGAWAVSWQSISKLCCANPLDTSSAPVKSFLYALDELPLAFLALDPTGGPGGSGRWYSHKFGKFVTYPILYLEGLPVRMDTP